MQRHSSLVTIAGKNIKRKLAFGHGWTRTSSRGSSVNCAHPYTTRPQRFLQSTLRSPFQDQHFAACSLLAHQCHYAAPFVACHYRRQKHKKKARFWPRLDSNQL
eukprot:INCI11670.1.p1 GENE.INCI11670.1~~INCI11670.1.p1  ORF type:complete len:118 (-),score=8.00 INCI11670.1:85-396(-)